jgi:hypothetical protein
MRLLNHSTGELVLGRCRSTNLCDYCARLAAVENTEMLWLNAAEKGSPSLWLLLTTSDPEWDGERFRRAFNAVWKAVRRRWPEAEYAALVEFTTGYGPRSGGMRRPHWNVFVYGVPVEDDRALWEVVSRVWCSRIAAAPKLQCVYHVTEDKGGMRGLTRYVGLHFQKESQAPPKGWRGQRFRASAGYFARPRMAFRAEARESLKLGRLVWKGLDLETARRELSVRAEEVWSLRAINPYTKIERRPRDSGASRPSLVVESSAGDHGVFFRPPTSALLGAFVHPTGSGGVVNEGLTPIGGTPGHRPERVGGL